MSSRLFRVMMLACVAVLLAGVVSAATYEDDGERVRLEDAANADEIEASDATTTTKPAADTNSTTSTTDRSTTTEEAAEATTSTTAPAAGSSAPTTAPHDDGLRATTPGKYLYDVSGTVDGEEFSGTSTLTVSELDPQGRQTHVQEGEDGRTTTVYRHTTEGTYLESLELSTPQGSFRMEATAPFLIVPADARSGTVTEGRLQGDGLTADITFTVVDLGPDTTTAELVADISGKVSGFDVDGRMTSTIIARTSDQLPLDTRSKSDISAGGGLMTSQSSTRSVLRQ